MAAKRVEYAIELMLGAKKRSNFDSTVGGVSSGINSLWGVAKKAAAGITAAFAAVNIKDTIADAMETYTGFEQATATTAAIAGASKTEYDKLEKAAREAGAATTKTAEESSEALGYMALAGWNVNDSIQGLMPILKLSESAQMYLAKASDLVTDSMSAMKLSVKDLPEYLDAVVQGNNSANMNAQQMMEAMILSGGAARTLSINYQDLGTAVGVLANNGTKSRKAGTAMNSMLTRIASNKSAIKMMNKLGISIFDTNGQFVGLENALKNINAGISGLTMEEQAKALKEIAGTNYYSKMIYLLDSVKEGANGAESAWSSLNEQLYDSDGALDKMDAQITGTANGAKQIMISAIDDAKISFGDAVSDEYVAILNDLAGGFNTLSEDITEFADENELKIHGIFEDIEDGAAEIIEIGGNIVDFTVDNIDLITSAIEGIGAAFVTAKITDKAMTFASVMKKVISADPATLVSGISRLNVAVAGVTAAAAIGVTAWRAYQKAEQRAADNNIDDHFGNIALSMDQIDDVAQQIVGKRELTKISVMLEKIGDTDKAIQSLSGNLKTVGGIGWKLKAGLELSKDDEEQYADQIKEAVTNAQNVIDSQGYAVSLATDLLLGSNSSIGMENDAFYAGLDAQINTLQKKLNKKISAAVKNGVDIDTDDAIQKLLGRITDITDAVTGAESEAQLQTIGLKYSGKELNSDTFKALSKDIAKYEKQVTSGAQEAYQTSMTNLNARLSMGDISKKKYNVEKSKLEEGYYQTRADAYSKGTDYITNTIQTAYPGVKAAMKQLSAKMDVELKAAMDKGITGRDLDAKMQSVAEESLKGLKVDKTTKNAISELYKNGLDDIYQQMEDIRSEISQAGYDAPESLRKSIETTDTILAASGGKTDAQTLLGDKIGNNAEYSTMVQAAAKTGGTVPENMAKGILEGKAKVSDAVNALYDQVESVARSRQIMAPEAVTINTAGAAKATSNTHGDLSKIKIRSTATTYHDANGDHTIYRNAFGGIYDREILTTIAEEGAEAIIPLDGSSRGKSLWWKAGQMLGMFGKSQKNGTGKAANVVTTNNATAYLNSKANSYNSNAVNRSLTSTTKSTIYRNAIGGIYGRKMRPPEVQSGRDVAMYESIANHQQSASNTRQDTINGGSPVIKYSPNIVIKGNADQKTVEKALDISQQKFEQLMERYNRSHKRISFGGA